MKLESHEHALVDVVRGFVDKKVKPGVRDLERADEYPGELIDQMKEMGLFGLLIPEPYGAGAVSASCFALVTEELARGWMSLAGAAGSHSVVSRLITLYGTEAQREAYLPRMATGELRAAMALTEPSAGSDLQAIRTFATVRDGDYVINGSKTWITNARRAGLLAVLCKTDAHATPRHTGVSILLVEKVPGVVVSGNFAKLGYKGVETCGVHFDDVRVPKTALLGEREGHGFAQMMHGLEVGRIQVAARAMGVARAAFDDAFRYSHERETFGKPIWQHQSVGNMLADMAASITAARQLLLFACDAYDAGSRSDLEAGMAKLFCSETAMTVVLNAMRIHGGNGYSLEFDVERYYRDAPLMIIGEGTNEIQRGIIARQLASRGGLVL
jgi:alkylation response protein AidB-like acyl-CoA dehydrogenase